MSLYGGGYKGVNEYQGEPDGLYQFSDDGAPVNPQPAPAPAPDPTEATNAALAVVLNPTSLLTDAASAPSVSWPVAVIGICVVGMIWANYLQGGRKS